MDERIRQLNQTLLERGVRLTPQRLMVLEVLAEHAGGHITADRVLAAVTQRYPYVDKATIYRTLDLLRRLSDPELAACPDCGAPVRRRISAPNTIIGNSHLTSEGHAAKHGFTQYRRAGGGVYEKTAGKGPDFISGD